MENNTLLAPIHIDALYLETAASCAEPRLDFSRLPYFNGQYDVNPYMAYLGDEIQSVPFRDSEFVLKKGVHLHWALPDALTRSFRYPLLDRGAMQRAIPDTGAEFSVDDLWGEFIKKGWVKGLDNNKFFASIVAGSEQIDLEISKMLASENERNLGQAILKVRYLLEPGGTQMPPVPNRWIITRTSINASIPLKRWIVESDCLAPADTENSDLTNAVPYPRQRQKPTDASFGWLGRKYVFGQPPAAAGGSEFLSAPLTATGYGDPVFAAFYPNCHSVFGFHDDLSYLETKKVGENVVTETKYYDAFAEGFTYEVIGYYNSPDWDYLRLVNLDTPNRTAPAELAKALHSMYHHELQLDFGADLEELLHMDESVGLPGLLNILPGNLVCGARLTLGGNAGSWKTGAVTELSLAVGNSGAEALATFLGNKISATKKLEVEEYLESLQFASSLDHLETDIGPKFLERRHETGFATEHGGWRWVLRPPKNEGGADAGEAAGEQVSLPDELAHFLHALNTLQLGFDRADSQVKSLRKQIYADWSRYMLSPYPPDGSDDEYPDADEALFYIETHQLPKLEVLNEKRQELAKAVRQKVEEFWLLKPSDVSDWMDLVRNLSNILGERPRKIESEGDMVNWVNHWILDPGKLQEALAPRGRGAAPGEDLQDRLLFDHFPVNRKLLESIVPGFIPVHPGLELKMKPAHHFYRPTDPVILLAGDDLKLTDKHGQDGLLKCLFLPDFKLEPEKAASLVKLSGIIQKAPTEFDAALFAQNQAAPSNHPMLLDWLVEYFPVKDRSNEGGELDGYSPSYVQDNYGLALNEIDLHPEKPDFAEAGHNFWGTALLTPQAGKNVKDALEIFLKAEIGKLELTAWFDAEGVAAEDRNTGEVLKRMESFSKHYFSKMPDAWLRKYFETTGGMSSLQWFRQPGNFDQYFQWDATGVTFAENEQPLFSLWESKHLALAMLACETLAETHYLSQSLGGFTQALLMHRQGFQLDIADPLGFPEYQDFTQKVSEAVGLLKHASTLPNNPFFPIRAGAMSLVELRLLDTFGVELAHLKDIENTAVLASEPLKPLENHHLHLAPRLTQPARLNFNWLSAGDDDIERNDHPAASPVCGWLLINYLDESLMIYDQSGAALGYLDQEGHWRMFPGHASPVLPEGIENRHLRRMVRWLAKKAQAEAAENDGVSQVVPHFIQLVEEALHKIEPERADHAGEGVAMLMSRPLALVRAMAQLELKGLPAVHQGWPHFRALIENPGVVDELTLGVETVKLPLRLGEDHQLNDGLIGFWEDADDGEAYRGDCFRVPSLHRSTGGTVETDHPILDTLTLGSDGSNSPGLRFSLLMDPHGAAHATCGILPVQELELPADLYADALRQLEISFLTAPVITPEGLTNISLPDEPGFHWSWISVEKRQWKEISTIGHFKKQELADAFGEVAENLWNDLLEKGWITVEGGEAVIIPKNRRPESEGFPAAGLAPKVELFLASRQIGTFQTTPNFHGPQEIREGWLKLRPAPELPPTKKESEIS
jgi:hypothetical protein